MIECPACQKYLPDDIVYCPYCGQPLPPAEFPWARWGRALRGATMGAVLGTLLFGLLLAMGLSLQGLPDIEPAPTETRQFFTPLSSTGSIPTLSLLTTLGGLPRDLIASPDYTYLAVGARLLVFNLNRSTPPSPMATLTLPHLIQQIYQHGPYLYLLTSEQQLTVVDITDPTQPTEVTSQLLSEPVHHLVGQGDYLYLFTEGGFLTFTVADDASQPRLLANYELSQAAQAMALTPNYLYLAAGGEGGGLSIIDISSPTTPQQVGQYETLLEASALLVQGDIVYLAERYKGLRLFNIANPTAPVEVGFYTPQQGTISHVAVAHDIAYLIVVGVEGETFLEAVAVNQPEQPERRSRYTMPAPVIAWTLNQQTEQLYVADEQGLRVFSLAAEPQNPVATGRDYEIWPTRVNDVAVQGDYLYLVDDGRGLRVVDIRQPRVPQQVGFYEQIDRPKKLLLAAEVAYLVDSLRLQQLDITDPTQPHRLNIATIEDEPWSLYRDGRRLYLADGERGVALMPLTEQGIPQRSYWHRVPGTVWDVVAQGAYAYAATDAPGVWVIDVTNPAQMSTVGTANSRGPARSLAFLQALNEQTGQLYLGVAAGSGFGIVDVSDPSVPLLVSHHLLPESLGAVHDLVVVGEYAFVMAPNGVAALYISTPELVQFVGLYQAPGQMLSMAVTDTHLYLADVQAGLIILQFTP